jgi:hypothetical protein
LRIETEFKLGIGDDDLTLNSNVTHVHRELMADQVPLWQLVG